MSRGLMPGDTILRLAMAAVTMTATLASSNCSSTVQREDGSTNISDHSDISDVAADRWRCSAVSEPNEPDFHGLSCSDPPSFMQCLVWGERLAPGRRSVALCYGARCARVSGFSMVLPDGGLFCGSEPECGRFEICAGTTETNAHCECIAR